MACKILALCFVVILQINSSFSISKSEKAAQSAIKNLLSEKISIKFKEAANEVKGVLVKNLGDSLKSAHKKMNSSSKKKKVNKMQAKSKAAFKPGTGKVHQQPAVNQGAAVHQNKGARNRKNLGGSSDSKTSQSDGGAAQPPPANKPSYGTPPSGGNNAPNPQQQGSNHQQPPTAGGMHQMGGMQMGQPMMQAYPPTMPQYAPPTAPLPPCPALPCAPPPLPACPEPPCAPPPACNTHPCGDIFERLGGSATCPPSCMMDCFNYCPSTCCRHKKKHHIPKKDA